MRHIIPSSKQKPIVVAIVMLVSFFGLQAASKSLGLFQIDKFLLISFYVYLFLVFWQSFIFDLHLKSSYTWRGLEKSLWQALKGRFQYMVEMHHFLHYLNYLILPAVIYWSLIMVMFLNPFDALLKQTLIFGTALAIGAITWY